MSADFYHVGYTSSHSNTEVKQHWAWILLGWETLQGIPGSAGTYPPPPLPLRTEYSLFRLSLSQSSDWDPLNQKKTLSNCFVKYLYTKVVSYKSILLWPKSLLFVDQFLWIFIKINGYFFQCFSFYKIMALKRNQQWRTVVYISQISFQSLWSKDSAAKPRTAVMLASA